MPAICLRFAGILLFATAFSTSVWAETDGAIKLPSPPLLSKQTRQHIQERLYQLEKEFLITSTKRQKLLQTKPSYALPVVLEILGGVGITFGLSLMFASAERDGPEEFNGALVGGGIFVAVGLALSIGGIAILVYTHSKHRVRLRRISHLQSKLQRLRERYENLRRRLDESPTGPRPSNPQPKLESKRSNGDAIAFQFAASW